MVEKLNEARRCWKISGSNPTPAGDLESCLLCGRPQYVIGIYVPGDTRIQLDENREKRCFAYALCDRCFGTVEAAVRVEKVIEADLLGTAPVSRTCQ
jgi:hypothetical protein